MWDERCQYDSACKYQSSSLKLICDKQLVWHWLYPITEQLRAITDVDLSQLVRQLTLKSYKPSVLSYRSHTHLGFSHKNDEDCLKVTSQLTSFFYQGTNSILEEETYIKDGLAKIVVEMVKREWPQQWPSFMNELHELCKQGVRVAYDGLILIMFHKLYSIN